MTLLVARAFGVTDPNILAALGAVVGLVPAAVTWVVVMVRKSPTP